MKPLTTIIVLLSLVGCASPGKTIKSTEAHIIDTLSTHGCEIKQYSHMVAMGKMHVECK